MKKPAAMSLLVICNLAVVFVMALINLVIFFMTFSLATAILIGLAALTALGFASSRALRLFKQQYGLRTRWFILASYVPSVVGAAVCFIVYLILNRSGYFMGYFAGLAEFLFLISFAPTATAYLISGTVWCRATNQI